MVLTFRTTSLFSSPVCCCAHTVGRSRVTGDRTIERIVCLSSFYRRDSDAYRRWLFTSGWKNQIYRGPELRWRNIRYVLREFVERKYKRREYRYWRDLVCRGDGFLRIFNVNDTYSVRLPRHIVPSAHYIACLTMNTSRAIVYAKTRNAYRRSRNAKEWIIFAGRRG